MLLSDIFLSLSANEFYLPLKIERKTNTIKTKNNGIKVACGEVIFHLYLCFFSNRDRFALSDNAFRLLIEENRSQCILIAGEL